MSDTKTPHEGGDNAAAETEARDAVTDGGGEGAELEQARREAEESRELLLRKAAELENFRKRAARDMENAVNHALNDFAYAMCDVRDCVISAINAGDDGKNLREGVNLILQKMDSALQANKILPVHPDRGLTFDPELHQAVVAEENGELPENAVISVLQTGYTINNRLLRPASVVVSKAPAAAAEGAQKDSTAGGEDSSGNK